MKRIINKWHSYLDMPKYDLAWHERDINDELSELNEASGFVDVWSELSDIAYTYTRANWAGHKDIKLPISKANFYFGLLYMFPKYTLRWKFYVALGKKMDKNLKLREVRNPKKIEKLKRIAEKYNLDEKKLTSEAMYLMSRWFFLK